MTERDSGIYTCIAANLAGKAKQNLELQVLGEYSFQLTLEIVIRHYQCLTRVGSRKECPGSDSGRYEIYSFLQFHHE
jgi:hypothetical protein